MHTTSATLLVRLREPDNQAAWARFVELYTPLLFYWAKKSGLQEQDAADLVQEIFALLLKKLPDFHYAPTEGKQGQFRAWLRTVTRNKWHEIQRKKKAVALDSADPRWNELVAPDDAAFWDREHDRFLVRRALESMDLETRNSKSWRVAWEVIVNHRVPAEVAVELEMTPNAAFIALSRLRKKLREELAGLLDD